MTAYQAKVKELGEIIITEISRDDFEASTIAELTLELYRLVFGEDVKFL
jgi:hypothetical protein